MKIKIFIILFFIIGCKKASDTTFGLNYFHLSNYLLETDTSNIIERRKHWEKEIGSFTPYFNKYILNRVDSNELIFNNEILSFINHKDMREVFDSINKKFHDFSSIERELNSAFRIFRSNFPNYKLPKIITMFSGFKYGVLAQDSIIAIGLDFFLGKKSVFYSYLGNPDYMKKQKEAKFIPPYVMEVWFNQLFLESKTSFDFLSKIIHKGKLMYFIDVLLPEYRIYDKLRFTVDEYKWSVNNEANIWNYFINNEILFSTNEREFRSYLNFAPFGKGMPRESPGRLGYFIGYKIISEYMRNNSSLSLQNLIQINDEKLILRESRYKPKK